VLAAKPMVSSLLQLATVDDDTVQLYAVKGLVNVTNTPLALTKLLQDERGARGGMPFLFVC